MKRTNRGNQRIYTFWAPLYDLLVGAPIIARSRKQAVRALELREGERLLLVGIGTGADIPLLPNEGDAVGIDLTRAMLRHARQRAITQGRQMDLAECDAERLPFPDATFDKALLTLIVSVVPHGRDCIAETLRVLRPGGLMVVFDKFLAEGKEASMWRRLFNVLTSFFGTDINRRFSDVTAGLSVETVSDTAGQFGAYRVIVLRKPR